MTRNVVVLDSALADLEKGKGFYDGCELGAGDYFVDSILADISSLKFYLGLHKVEHGYHRMLPKRFPFAIYYEVIGSLVRIIAVIDMRQDPLSISKTLALR